jgi:hypothetical protein
VTVQVVAVFISQVPIAFAPTYAHMFQTIDYKLWFIVGETEFTHATQDRDHGQSKSQRRTVGPTDYNTPQYSSSSYSVSDTSQSSLYPMPDISMQPPTRWVYEWEDPHFYTMLFQQWQTKIVWTGPLGESEKSERIPEHQSTETQERQNPKRNPRKMRRQRISKRLPLPQKL